MIRKKEVPRYVPPAKSKRNPKPTAEEDTRLDAYYRWQKRGSPNGDDLTDWLAAERREEEQEIEGSFKGEERRWGEENPQDEEPNEAP